MSTKAAFDSHESESFLTGTSSIYAEQMWEAYQRDPNSVQESWRHYFDNLENGVAFDEAYYSNPTMALGPKAQAKVSLCVSVSIELLPLLVSDSN